MERRSELVGHFFLLSSLMFPSVRLVIRARRGEEMRKKEGTGWREAGDEQRVHRMKNKEGETAECRKIIKDAGKRRCSEDDEGEGKGGRKKDRRCRI